MDMSFTTNESRTVSIKSVSGNGYVGQMIVLTNVIVSDSKAFANYEQPALFVITEIISNQDHWDIRYRVRDFAGVELEIGDKIEGSLSASYFYDAQEFLIYERARNAELLRQSKARAAHLESQRDLLKSILTPNGLHVVSADVARSIGIVK